MTIDAAQLAAIMQHAMQQALAHAPRAAVSGGGAGGAGSSARADRPRLPPPPRYGGSADTLDEWLNEIRRQVAWYGAALATDSEQVIFATSLLQGAAYDWWTNAASQPTTLQALEAALRERFQPINSAEMARAKLLSLAQGRGSVHDYVAAFRQLLVKLPRMDEGDRLFHFVRGLQPAIATQVRVQGVKTMDKAIELAVRVGSLVQYGAATGTGSAGHAASSSSSSSSLVAAPAAAAAHAPMELDNIEGLEAETAETAASAGRVDTPVTQAQFRELLNALREGRRGPSSTSRGGGRSSSRVGHRSRGLPQVPHLSPLQVQEYMSAGKCFGCGSTEHQSRSCPKRNEGADGRVRWTN